MKSHIGPNGPGKCTATVKDCPFGGEDNHFNTIVAARQEYEARLEKAYSEEAATKSTKLRLTAREQEIRAKNADMAKELVELRGKVGGITFEDANPERAERRLKESITFAEGRGNIHLVEKLAHAKVLPSGAFKLEDGSRANVDNYLKSKQALDAIDDAREKMLGSINDVIRTDPTATAKFSLKTEAGSFSLTIKPGFDQKEFDKLPAGLQEKIKSDKTGLSIDAARENLSPKLLEEVSSTSQVVDFVIGKPTTTDVAGVPPKTELTGDTTDDKVNSGLKNIADFYGGVRKEIGTAKDLRGVVADNNTAVKSATAKDSGPIFVPARSQSNGLVVTRRQSLTASLVNDKLTQEQIAAITVTRREVDAKLAQTILPAKTFDKIFGTPTASLRVTEASS